MELKLVRYCAVLVGLYLLLIVPYGIETIRNLRSLGLLLLLLIVPYGIETIFLQNNGAILYILLIVPYGIETRCSPSSYSGCNTFNRTLWN